MGKIKKIIFFLEWRFCQRDYERFGIKILRDNGFDVEIWEFMPYLQKSFYKIIEPPDPISFKEQRLFSSINAIKSAVSNLDNSCFVINMFPYRPETYSIYRILSKKGLKYAIYHAGSSHPCASIKLRKASPKLTFFSRVGKKLKRISNKSLRRQVILRLPARFLGIRHADLILAGAAKSHFYASPIGKYTKILWIHYLDFDIYLNEIKKSAQIDNKMVVFLDEYLPFHPDWDFCNVSSPIAPDDYYPTLCKFFDYLEKKHSVRISIAAHPRSHYEKHPDYFGGRPVIRGQTASLVRKSRFVLSHSSYSINFAILFRKPIIFMTTNKLNQSFMENLINGMAESVGKKATNLSDGFEFNWENELKVNDEKYNYYRHCYIKKKETEELPFWQIVANQIKQF